MEADWNLTEAIEYYRGQNVSQDQQALIELLREVQAENGGSIPVHPAIFRHEERPRNPSAACRNFLFCGDTPQPDYIYSRIFLLYFSFFL